MTVDDIAEMAPERAIVPINWFDKWTFLVSQRSRALFEGITGRPPDWHPAVQAPANRPRRRIECDRPVVATAEDLCCGDRHLGVVGEPLRLPERPVLKPVRRGVCGALADPVDTSALCGLPGVLYPCGYRCEGHRPRPRSVDPSPAIENARSSR
jgi:hypothetical protein